MDPGEIARALERAKVVAIVRLDDPTPVVPVVRALVRGGLRAVEITLTTPRAVELIADLHAELGADIMVGAGTVLDTRSVDAVAAAGARFVVSPIFKRELIAQTHAAGMAALPGCFSPTEIFDAWSEGADIVKVFPATPLGPSFLKDVLGPLPDLKLMPTGGVTLDNAHTWLRAGACAVGLGGALVDRALIEVGNLDALTERARTLLSSLTPPKEVPSGVRPIG